MRWREWMIHLSLWEEGGKEGDTGRERVRERERERIRNLLE
jgi:hypothetical protein